MSHEESHEDRLERAKTLLVDSAEGLCGVEGDFVCSYVGLEYDAATGSRLEVSGTANFTLTGVGNVVTAPRDGQGATYFNFQLNPTRPKDENDIEWLQKQPTRRICSFLSSSDANRKPSAVCFLDAQAGWGEVHFSKDCSTFDMVLGSPLLPTSYSSPTALRYECVRVQ